MSKKVKSVFVSAAGLIGGFVDKLVSKFQALGGTDEQLHELLVGKRSEDFISQVVDLAMKMVSKGFPIWKTITIGTHGSVKAYRKALNEAGFHISDWASDILDRIQVSAEQVELDLIKLTVRDLGFAQATFLKQIFAKAKDLGLELCPADAGPALRLAYQNQPYGECFYIAMEPITGSDGNLEVFEVDHGHNGRWLSGRYDVPGDLWGPDNAFVFVLPRK